MRAALVLLLAVPLFHQAPARARAVDGCVPTTNVEISERELGSVFDRTASTIASQPACRDAIHRYLVESPCTQAYGAIASAAMESSAWDPAFTREVFDRAAGNISCAKRVFPAVQRAARVDAPLVASVTRATKSPEVGEDAWLVLGSLARTLRASDPARAAEIDIAIDAELATHPSNDVLLDAAGNAGCARCAKYVEHALEYEDGPTRRVAVSALRFVPNMHARLCGVLELDRSPAVRAQAAWALGFGDVRAVPCLRAAAASDEDEAVRLDARRALEQLGGT